MEIIGILKIVNCQLLINHSCRKAMIGSSAAARMAG